MTLPILYSFRRCPYAMRARLAVDAAGVRMALREVVLRDKPAAFLVASPSATVPCLVHESGAIDESLDIMIWALGRHDPEGWLDMPGIGNDLIARTDGPFKSALDRYKYASRYKGVDSLAERACAAGFVTTLEAQLDGRAYLFGTSPRLADMAILPFIRQFAHVEPNWFAAQSWPGVQRWLAVFEDSDRFARMMPKVPQWQPGDAPVWFPF